MYIYIYAYTALTTLLYHGHTIHKQAREEKKHIVCAADLQGVCQELLVIWIDFK